MLAAYGTPATRQAPSGGNAVVDGASSASFASKEVQPFLAPESMDFEARGNGDRDAAPCAAEAKQSKMSGIAAFHRFLEPEEINAYGEAPRRRAEPEAPVKRAQPFLVPEAEASGSLTQAIASSQGAVDERPSQARTLTSGSATEQALVTETEASDEVDNDSDEVAAAPVGEDEADFEIDNDDDEEAAAATLAEVAEGDTPMAAASLQIQSLLKIIPEASEKVSLDGAVPSIPNDMSPSGAEDSNSSGRILMLLLKGRRNQEQLEGAEGALPASLRSGAGNEQWAGLLGPFCNADDPKRFVNADAFDHANGVVVQGTGSHPCVLKEVPEQDILVMYKPSGWATCSTPHWEGVEGNLIRWVWKRHHCTVAAPCHRLDRGTSGAVVVAKSRGSLRHICAQITGRTLVKQYIALVRGHIDPPQGALSMPLALSSMDKPLGPCAIEGRAAVTRYRVLGYFSRGNENGDSAGRVDYSLLQLQIDHGRQHQIRLHMATIGHPVVFDVKYSQSFLQEDSRVTSRLFLHAAYVKCTLPPDGEHPLTVACRLPPQLRQALTTVLHRERSFEENLPAKARELCDVLLEPDAQEGSAAGDSPFEARLAARRRDEFFRSFSFSKPEREEVVRILAQLPTAEDRSNAMLKFRVNGDGTPEAIVASFERYVDELLKQKAEAKAEKEAKVAGDGPVKANGANDSASAVDAGAEAQATPAEKEKLGTLQEENGGYGPVSLHSEFVTCNACGQREKVDFVQFPALQIKLSCRVTAAPMAEPMARLLASAAQHEAAEAAAAHGAEPRPPPLPQRRQSWNPVPSPPPPPPAPKARGSGSGSTSAVASEAGKVDDKEAQLSRDLLKYLEARGGSANGPTVASEFAARFNAWVRVDARRNDGSLRKWIGSQPGVTVENCGGNRWNVWLDLEAKAKAQDSQAGGEAEEDGEWNNWTNNGTWYEEDASASARKARRGSGQRNSWSSQGNAHQGGHGKGGYGGGRGSWVPAGKGGGNSRSENHLAGIGLWQ